MDTASGSDGKISRERDLIQTDSDKRDCKTCTEGECDIGILPGPLKAYENAECEMQEEKTEKDLVDVSYLREKLNVCIPKDHELAEKEELTMAQINGFNCLLRDQIGFWTDLCHEKMPASKFLVQTDEFAFEELIRASTLFVLPRILQRM